MPVEGITTELAARSRGKVITARTELAAATGRLWDPEAMADAVRAREDMQPTAMDSGVALLHPRRPLANALAEPVVALGRVDGGIPFGGAGGTMTDIFFLICSTGDREHLRILARLARMLSDDNLIDNLRIAAQPIQMLEALAVRETELLE